MCLYDESWSQSYPTTLNFHKIILDLICVCTAAPCLEYGVTFETHIVEKFGVSFGREGETLSLGCSVIIYPSLQRFQPEIEWYRDGKSVRKIIISPHKIFCKN